MKITPEIYARWRESYLGSLTERLEPEAVFSLAGDPSGLKVLDIGCGDGSYAIEVSRREGNTVGLDRSLAMLAAAVTRAASQCAMVNWCQGTADCLPFRDSSFDMVLAVTALCWMPEPAMALKEIHRVLRPGGTAIVGELGRWSLWALARRFRDLLGSRSWRGCHFWTGRELTRVLAAAGLRAVEIRGAVYYPPSNFLAGLMARCEKGGNRRQPFGAAFIAIKSVKDKPSDAATEARI